MRDGWKRVRLGDFITDIAAGPFGSNLKVECFVPSGFPIIDGANLKEYKVTDNITKFVTEAKARSLHRSIARRFDVVVTISGTIGQISYIPEDSKYSEYLCSQRQFRASFDSTEVYVPYLIYYFHTREGQSKILMFANQVGVPALAQPLKNFRNIEISLPPLPTQQRIAAVLGALDDKIELNRKMNANLEAQAQALFKSWFIDFEPWGGQMPAGWKKGSLGDVAALNRDVFNPILYPKAIVDHFSLPAFDEGRVPVLEPASQIKSNKILLTKDSLLVSKLNPTIKRVWRPSVVCDLSVGSTEFLVFEPKVVAWRPWLFSVLNSDDYTIHLIEHATGSTNSHQRVSPADALAYEIDIPDDVVVLMFSEQVDALYSMIQSNINESRQLAALRDALLPKLMSGELSVEEVA